MFSFDKSFDGFQFKFDGAAPSSNGSSSSSVVSTVSGNGSVTATVVNGQLVSSAQTGNSQLFVNGQLVPSNAIFDQSPALHNNFDFHTSQIPDFRTFQIPDFHTSQIPDIQTSHSLDFQTSHSPLLILNHGFSAFPDWF
jgi:hypothetical protein